MTSQSASTLLTLLRREGHQTIKRLGQHFLADEYLLLRIAEATCADAQTLVVEIGPGPGTLTTAIADRGARIVAIERDKQFQTFHRKIFKSNARIEIIYDDALAVDLWKIARDHVADYALASAVLAGNIPFQITSPLLFGQIGPGQPWRKMVLMVQREVADRITAKPGNRTYGILTVKLAYWWKVTERFEIPSSAFRPMPKVDASTLIFEPTDTISHPSAEVWSDLSRFIDAAFNQRRKKLYNSLAETWQPSPAKESIRQALASLGIDTAVRAETLSPSQFYDLFKMLGDRRPGL